jgi:hypothetical protein
MLAQLRQRPGTTYVALAGIIVQQALDAIAIGDGNVETIRYWRDRTFKRAHLAPDLTRNPALRRIVLRPGLIDL